MKVEEIKLAFETNVQLSTLSDIANERTKLVNDANNIINDINALSKRLLPLAGSLSMNQKKSITMLDQAKSLGADDFVNKYKYLSNNLSGDLIKISDNVSNNSKNKILE